MADYQSFSNSIKKLQKIWNKNEANTSEIDNNLSKLQLNFDSINFSKKITTIPVLTDYYVSTFLVSETIVIDLNNIPDWLVNHINIVPIVSIIGDINTDNVLTNLSQSPSNIGDISFFSDTNYWIVKISENNYQLKITFTLIVTQATSITPPESDILPFNLNLSLKIINPRIYENTNIHKT